MNDSFDAKGTLQDEIRVLLIDDDEVAVRHVQSCLSLIPNTIYRFRHVTRFTDAVDLLSQEDYDLILLDLALPDGYGLDGIPGLRDIAPDVPLIVLTGLDNEEIALRAVREGVQDYLIKDSIDSNSLARAIRYAIERQRMVRQLEQARQLEQYLAYHDALTGLPNRKLLLDRLQHQLSRSKRVHTLFGLFSLDLDGFKKINDTLGYAIGDKLLKTTANRLKGCVRESDTVARTDGDEFMMIIDNLQQEQDALFVCKKILNTMAQPFVEDNHKFYMTASIGVSLYPFDGSDAETLIKNADIALYRAKTSDSNSFQLYNLSMDAQLQEKQKLENELRRLLSQEEQDELFLYYQPLLNLHDGSIKTMEALLRWKHPEMGMIPPDKFIPIAEETGLIDPLGEWIINSACRQNKMLQENGFAPLRVAVNLSTKQFRQRGILETITHALVNTGLQPEFLSLEITETSAMLDVNYTIRMLKHLKEMGIQISVDDFGTGYSSLSYLKKLPADILKIDRSFINGVPEDRNDTSITSAIIHLAHNLDLKVTAEGVENHEQLSFLQSMKCDELQGYHFSKPVSFEDLCQILP